MLTLFFSSPPQDVSLIPVVSFIPLFFHSFPTNWSLLFLSPHTLQLQTTTDVHSIFPSQQIATGNTWTRLVNEFLWICGLLYSCPVLQGYYPLFSEYIPYLSFWVCVTSLWMVFLVPSLWSLRVLMLT